MTKIQMLGYLRQRQVGSALEIVTPDETIVGVLVRAFDQTSETFEVQVGEETIPMAVDGLISVHVSEGRPAKVEPTKSAEDKPPRFVRTAVPWAKGDR